MSANEDQPQNINDETPQDRVKVETDHEWDYVELFDPGDDQALPWYDRQ